MRKKDADGKVDVLLMTPPCIELYKGMRDIAPISPPLGLISIAAVLEKENIKVGLSDTYAEGLDYPQISRVLGKAKPRILGLTCVTSNFNEIVKIAEIAKRRDRDMLVVVGGPHVSAVPKETLKRTRDIDIVVIGEGDYTLRDIYLANLMDRPLSGVPGIAYREKGRIILTETRPLVENLDDLPLPARHLLKHHLYRPSKDMSAADSFFTILSSRGCPNMCTFCSSKILFGVKVRFRSADSIVREIEEALSLYKTSEIVFMDDTFTVDKERVIEICERIKHFNLKWGCLARVNTVDERVLRKMRQAGCHWIGYGVESGSQMILNRIKKGITLEQTRKAFRLTHKVGIPCTAFFILGHLDDTPETIEETIRFSKEIDATFAQFNVLTPYPGTEVYARAAEKGAITRDFEHYGNPKYRDPVIKLDTMTEKQLKRYWKKANREFYFRPKILYRMTRNALRSKEEFKRLLSIAGAYLKMK